MRFWVRRPSLAGRWAARTSWRRYVRHSLGLKAPRGFGWLTDPRRALYNRVYSRTSVDAFRASPRRLRLIAMLLIGVAIILFVVMGR